MAVSDILLTFAGAMSKKKSTTVERMLFESNLRQSIENSGRFDEPLSDMERKDFEDQIALLKETIRQNQEFINRLMDQLKEQGIAYECKKSFWRANGKAMAMNETEGMLKLFVSPDGLILGCHAYGAHSADIVQEVSVLMCKHTTIAELADMVHIHPTLSEILKTAVD